MAHNSYTSMVDSHHAIQVGDLMQYKLANRYRSILFALIMSCSTALIVSGVIIYLQHDSKSNFLMKWLGAFITAWPIVFVAILVVAPIVNKALDRFVESDFE